MTTRHPPTHQSVESILDFIKIASLTNSELNELRNKISDLIVYKHEFNGITYTLDKPPPMQEDDLKIDEKAEFQRLVVPYINTYSFAHVEDINDLAVAVQLIHKAGMKIVPHAFKAIIEQLLGKINNLEGRILTKAGRKAIRTHFKKKVELFEIDVKDFIFALKHKKGDIFTQVTPIVAVALLKILLLLL